MRILSTKNILLISIFFLCAAGPQDKNPSENKFRPNINALDCPKFFALLDTVKREELEDTWIDSFSVAQNEKRIIRRNELLVKAYHGLVSHLVSSIPELKNTSVYVYPMSGPDILWQEFGPVYSVNRDPKDIDIGRKLLATAGIPSDHVQAAPSRLVQDPRVMEDLRNDHRKPKTLVLKKFSLFSETLGPDARTKLLSDYLEKVDTVLILDSEDAEAFSSQILNAGFVAKNDINLYSGNPLIVGAAIEGGGHKSMMIPDRVMLLTRSSVRK